MDPQIQIFSINLTVQIIPEVEKIIETYKLLPEHGFDLYYDFIKKFRLSLKKLIIEGLDNPAEVGFISPRLLRDPVEEGNKTKKKSLEEQEAHVVSYLKAILQLLYCISKGLTGVNYLGTRMHEKIIENQTNWSIESLSSYLYILQCEIIENGSLSSEIINKAETARIDAKKKENSIIENHIQYLYDQSDEKKTDISFTARLMAYYRAQESKKESPLIIDPFAEDLAGDLESYVKDHKFTAQRGDYPIVRSYYIDRTLLIPWCSQIKTQIVLLGSGFDTRAYRLLPLQRNDHTLFEIDYEDIIHYKQEILQNKSPLCHLVRLDADITDPNWKQALIRAGFSSITPTFWLLEGLIYYIDQTQVISLLRTLADISCEGSQIFADVCVPALAELVFGAFTRYFKWGIAKNDIPNFFAQTGWCVSCSYADDHSQGKDVGQRGMIFVYGEVMKT